MFILENVKRQVVVQIFTWFNFVQTVLNMRMRQREMKPKLAPKVLNKNNMLNHNTQTTSVKGISSRIQLNTNFHLWGNYEIFQIPFAEYEVLPVVAVWQTK